MEVNEVITITSILLVAGGFLWLLWRARGSPVDVFKGAEDLETAIVFAREMVLAAEQLWETGQIRKDARFDYVMEKLEMVFPNIDADALEALLEAAVKWAKIIAPRIEAIVSNGEDEGWP